MFLGALVSQVLGFIGVLCTGGAAAEISGEGGSLMSAPILSLSQLAAP